MNHIAAETKVALLYGGTSQEREISLMSGEGVLKALKEMGYQVTAFDTKDLSFISKLIDGNFDVCFVALHGVGGEDGTLQGLLELLDIPYTGPGALASALAMDKPRAKIIFKDAGLHVAKSLSFSKSNVETNLEKVITQIEKEIGFPCVVKPTDDGSAIGTTIVKSKEDLHDAFKEAFVNSPEIMAEAFLEGVEITCGVLGNEDPYALPVIEIVPQSEFYDFYSKYTPGASEHIIPARISDETTQAVQEAALVAHKALGCTGISRTDMIIDGDGIPWVLETNTIPGMTQTSLFPDEAAYIGISYNELVAELIELALQE